MCPALGGYCKDLMPLCSWKGLDDYQSLWKKQSAILKEQTLGTEDKNLAEPNAEAILSDFSAAMSLT